MAALLGGSSNIITSASAYLFDADTDVENHHKDFSDDDGNDDRSSAVTSNPLHAGKSKVATTTPKMSKLFNQSEDIKVVYFGNF